MRKLKKDQGDQVVIFGSYRLDPGSGRLWRGTQVVKLTPKAFVALRYFVAHPGQLVTKDDLFAAVWVTVDEEIALLTSASKPCVKVSLHAAPQ